MILSIVSVITAAPITDDHRLCPAWIKNNVTALEPPPVTPPNTNTVTGFAVNCVTAQIKIEAKITPLTDVNHPFFAAYPAATDATALSYAQNMTDEAKKDAIQRIVGVEIKTYDSLAAVEKFDEETKGIKPVTIENFKSTNVSLVPNGQIGTIKSVQPMVFTDDPTQRIAWFDGGRTLITNRFESKTKTMYVESEMAVLCVPNMPQYMQIYTVTV